MLVLLRFIPFILAGFSFINTIFTSLNIVAPIIVELATISFLPLLFFYITSYALKFCEYHRIPLHYIVTNRIISIIDYHFQIPISDYNWIIITTLIFGAFAIGCGIMKLLNK